MYLNNILNKIKKNKKGQEAIEIAIMFPIMAMMMLTTFDISQILKANWEAKQLARIGIRTAVMTGSIIANANGSLVQNATKPMDKASALETIAATYNNQHKNEANPRITLSSRKNKSTDGILFLSEDAYWQSGNRGNYAPSGPNVDAGKYNRIQCEVCMDVKLIFPLARFYPDADGNIYTTCQTYYSHHSTTYRAGERKPADNVQ